MQQYRRVKARLPGDTILFFRLGDFYEMFFEDAVEASGILGIALTRRNKVPMCGVPYHASDSYLAKLIRAGKKVAVCDQVEEPAASRGIVRREVTSIVTPGAVLSDALLDSGRNNYLAGFCETGGIMGLAMIDVSTGSFWVEETGDAGALRDNLMRFTPAECVMPEEAAARADSRADALPGGAAGITASRYDDWPFEYETARDTLIRHFKVQSLDCFGMEGRRAAVCAAGGLLHYFKNALLGKAGHVKSLRVSNPSDFLVMDEATRANLDLVAGGWLHRTSPSCAGGRGYADTLLGVMDSTRTAMGGRLIREWVLRPLAGLDGIRRRHDAVESLCADRGLLGDLREALGRVRDLERITARLGAGGGNARDARALGLSLAILPAIRDMVARPATAGLFEPAQSITPLPDIVELIGRAIVEEPPASLKEGGIIRRGYSAELDELRDSAAHGRNWLAEYQSAEQERTGIKTLKVRHNKVFGYYIEISKGQSRSAPENYSRKQTLVNAERFITPELKEHESRILGAQERATALEHELFAGVREAIVRETESILASAGALARLDALASLAERALSLRYVRPVITDKAAIKIVDGRHPVIEQIPASGRFVPNDTLLDDSANRLILITGPNMAGKSTYVRQVALIVIMAQIGSFVPAAEAEIGVVDRLFTRVGAGDDLAGGRSTFMVEMQETANILHNATRRSLVVLDEIGRGTSTFDGISIAWAVAEYLHNEAKARTMFATHYHELTELALTLPAARNYNVLVREQGDDIAFLRKIAPGATDKSYGIHVARLAGLPDDVIERAREILLNLEDGELGETGQPKIAARRARGNRKNPLQRSLF